jgi:hypothetical protein
MFIYWETELGSSGPQTISLTVDEDGDVSIEVSQEYEA